MTVDSIKPGQTIAFYYAGNTASNRNHRIAEVVENRPSHLLVKEVISPSKVQYRQFHKSAMLHIDILI